MFHEGVPKPNVLRIVSCAILGRLESYDIRPGESIKNTGFPNTLPGEKGVLWKI